MGLYFTSHSRVALLLIYQNLFYSHHVSSQKENNCEYYSDGDDDDDEEEEGMKTVHCLVCKIQRSFVPFYLLLSNVGK